MLEYELGNVHAADRFLDEFIEFHQTMRPDRYGFAYFPLIARITGDTRFLETAEASARCWLDINDPTGVWGKRARMGLALIAVIRCDRESAAEQYTELRSWRALIPTRFEGMTLARALGLMAALQGNWEDAFRHLFRKLRSVRQREVSAGAGLDLVRLGRSPHQERRF